MASNPLSIEQVLTLLAATPPRIATLTIGLAPTQLRTPPQQDGWSANDVLAHLRACADVWGNCIATIIAEDMPSIKAINPRSWIKQTNYRTLDFHTSFQAYTAQRAALLAVLEPLPPHGWARKATITGAGNALERTVLSYAQWLARHERSHIKQIERLAATVHSTK